MMMFRVLLTVLSIATIQSAEAAQISQVELSSVAGSQSIQMMDQRFEPIYEQQAYQATCNREVLDHMEAVCSTVSDTVCHGTEGQVCRTESDQVCNSQGCVAVPRRVCHEEHRVCEVIPRRVCVDHAVMRTEFYGCTQYRSVVVGQRLVKTFQHQVEVMVDRPELLQGQRLVISLVAREASVAPTLVSSFSLNLLTVESQIISNIDQGNNQITATRILIHVDIATAAIGKILSSSIQGLNLSGSGISMNIAGLAELSQSLNIGMKLTQRMLIGHKTLFNGTLDSANLSTEAQGDSLKVMIPLSKIGVAQMKAKKHSLVVSVSLKRPSLSILNSNDMAAVMNKRLEASQLNIIPN